MATSQMTTQAATTITPGTSNKTAIAAGIYATGAATVAGDDDLVVGNIKSDVNIFGVAGTVQVVEGVGKALSSIYSTSSGTWAVTPDYTKYNYLILTDYRSSCIHYFITGANTYTQVYNNGGTDSTGYYILSSATQVGVSSSTTSMNYRHYAII